MKKIITLLLAAGAFVAVHAQKSKDEARGIILGGGSNSGGGNSSTKGRDIILGGGNDNTANYPTYPNSYPGTNGSRQSQVDQVNREYDAKIYSIRNNGTLTQSEKERMIRQLEKDRAQRINQIDRNSNNGYSRSGKNCDDDNHKSKSNNGKHKGWTQGKGNQKKNKGYDD